MENIVTSLNHEEIIKSYVKRKSSNKTFDKCALFAQDFVKFINSTYSNMVINDNFSEIDDNDQMKLYVYNSSFKIYERFDETAFKKMFLEYVSRKYGDDTTLLFSNRDLYDIYELAKLYSDYMDFEINNFDSNNDLIILINGMIFNVDKLEFIPWEESYIKDRPFIYRFTYEGTHKEIINAFKVSGKSASDFMEAMDGKGLSDDVDFGISEFELIDFLMWTEDDEYGFDETYDDMVDDMVDEQYRNL